MVQADEHQRKRPPCSISQGVRFLWSKSLTGVSSTQLTTSTGAHLSASSHGQRRGLYIQGKPAGFLSVTLQHRGKNTQNWTPTLHNPRKMFAFSCWNILATQRTGANFIRKMVLVSSSPGPKPDLHLPRTNLPCLVLTWMRKELQENALCDLGPPGTGELGELWNALWYQ